MKANHKENTFIFNNKKEVIRPGQFITGRKKLSQITGIAESQVYKILNYFEKECQIEQQKNNRFTIVTVLNWHKYQSEGTGKEQPRNNQVTTREQPGNTNKNDKNVKNDKNNIYKSILNFFNNRFNSSYRLTDKLKSHIKQRLKNYKLDELKTAIGIMASIPFYQGQNDRGWRADPQYLFRNDDNVDKMLNKAEIKNKLNKADKIVTNWNEVKEKRKPEPVEEELTKEQKRVQKIQFYESMIKAESPKSEEYRKLLKELESK